MTSNNRLFRFGVLDSKAQTREEWEAKARRAEELGYSILLTGDHVAMGELSATPALMAAANVTRSLRIGSYVYNNDFRHPALLAKEATTLDRLSSGRFEFGLGAGYLPSDYGQLGLTLDSPGTRIRRLQEALHIIKGYFHGDGVTFSGSYYKVTHLQSAPKPTQQVLPIMVGGAGKRMLTLAGQEANIVALSLTNLPGGGWNMAEATPSGMSQKVEWVRQAAGNRFSELELNVLVYIVVITNMDREQRAAQIAGRFGITGEQLLEMPFFLIGSVDEMCHDLQVRRERFGISYVVVLHDSMETFAPIVARLTGK